MKVAVAVIIDSEKQVLIAKRPQHVSHPDFWEFPGGKLEENESPASALIREIKEEVGIHVISYDFLGEINHQYDDKQIDLLIFHVSEFSGIAQCLENQPEIRWVNMENLSAFTFPAANQKIIELIREKVI